MCMEGMKRPSFIALMASAQPDRRCSYEKCKRPEQSNQFIQIDGASKAGGKDWKPLHGRVICNACYIQYFKRGTLTRTQNQGKALPEADRHCSFDGCKKPHESSRFYEIDGGSSAGGQDWKPVDGRILCQACYDRYRAKGSLDRGPSNGPPSVKRCSYEGCKRPTESRQFIQIDGDSQAGSQNWKQMAGKVLCHTCYYHYLRSGTLERSKARPQASSGSGSKIVSSSSSSSSASTSAVTSAPAPAPAAATPSPAQAPAAPCGITQAPPPVVVMPMAIPSAAAGWPPVLVPSLRSAQKPASNPQIHDTLHPKPRRLRFAHDSLRDVLALGAVRGQQEKAVSGSFDDAVAGCVDACPCAVPGGCGFRGVDQADAL